MIYLILSILASTLIFVIFKLFEKYDINILHAIITNYVIACFCGIASYKGDAGISDIPSFPWFYYTIALGALFILIFNLMARTTQKRGLAVVSVATKMSVVLPVIFGLIYYQESLGIYKGIGILLAIVAVYLASMKSKNGLTIKPSNLLLPLLVFLGSGTIDTSIKYLEEQFVTLEDIPLFSATIFAAAFFIGLMVLMFEKLQGRFTFSFKNIVAGVLLGVPNYFSIYFLVKALRSDLLESSGIFTVNNVAIVMASTFVGIIVFRERLLFKNWIGIALAIISIFLVTFETW
ncbi:MAG: drug/metabolite transporter (DMT)-like permease [Planctomycetota bacterium]|uniref:EamA/RhaT family transporter n=1 Tax=Patiriisocius sp. Uisw_047 TaxID=3230969 RepID=UPI0039ECF6DF